MIERFPGPSGAAFSENREHRWLLWRRWGDASLPDRWFMVIGLNPSKADEWRSDPTVSQMVNRAKRLGYTGLLMLNTHAIVGTYPSILKRHPDPVGNLNLEYILDAARHADMIVCAWGTLAGATGEVVERMLRYAGYSLHAFALTKEWHPRHPRGLSLSRMPEGWPPIS